MEQQESMLLAAARAGDDMSVARYLKLKWGSSRQRINCNCVDAEGRTPLSLAASRGHIAVVEVLLAAEADLDIADANGKTALSSAAYHDNVAVVEALLAAGADTDRADKSGLTALLEAAMLNRVHVVELLLASGANVDHEDSHGNTALMNAASYGHLRVVNVLLAAGATIDHATRLGETALLLAASDGHTSVVRVLLEAGADPTVTNKRGRTALNYAESSGYKAIADLLRNSAGDPTTAAFSAISRGDLDALKQVLAKETNVRGYNDRTPLYFAASRGRLDMVKYLVATDSTIDYKDFEGDTALIVAARMGHAKVVRLLLEAGASPEIENRDKRTALQEAETHRYKEIVDLLGNYEGSAAATFAAIARDDLDGFKSVVDKHKNARGIHDRTPLHVAASRGRLDMVQLLVDRDVNVNIRDADDWTPLHHACQSGHVAIVNLLLARGSRADAADSEGRPPVVIAVANGHVDVLHELHTSGASLHSVGHDGRTLLHHATSRADNGPIVEYLLNASKSPAEDVNALDRTKSSPLHHAARTANTAAVALLLSSGADMDAQNEDGETALIIACAGGSAEIVQTLLSNGAKTDLVSVSGETARSAAKSEEIQAAVQLFLNSQRYHERCSELMSSIDTKPTDDDLKELVPLITSAYDLRLFMSLISLTFDGEPAAKCPARGLLLNSALSHVANSKLVFDDDACVFFKLVLDHCKTNSWLTSRELLMLDRQAEKVNNENADWVLELQRKVHDHSWRLDNHEQSLKRVVDGITQVHAMVQENREAIKSVHNRMDNIQAQVDMGKRLLTQVVANGNRLSDHVMHLKERLEESERKVQGVAEGLHNFQNAYVARQEQEQKNKRIKMIGGLLASTVGFVFAPALKEVFDTVIDLANPVEVFNIAFGGEKGIGDFLADKFSEHVLTPFVGDQFEKLMIPQDQFEALLREQIVLQNPELVEECVKQGYAIDVDAYGGSGQAEYALTMQPELESEESVINGLLGELQLAVAGAMTNPNFTNERRPHYEVRSSEDWSVTASRKSIDNQREEEPRFVEQAVEAAKQEVKKEKVKKTEVKKEESKVEKMVKKMEKKEEKKPEPVSSPKRPSLARAPAAGAVPQEPASVDSVSPNAEIVFIEDADEFPFHAAIRESQGQVDEFCELVNVLAGDKDDPSAVMHMQLRSGSTASEESICAAEYAYCLGHKEVGDFLASRMASKVSNTTKATSVELLEDDDEFVYVSIVEGCGGDVDDCEFMCEAIEADGHAIDARIKAKVVRESCVDVKWTAVEYAAHLGYVDIVMKLLKEWSQNLPGKTKIQLMKQAKISARGLTV